MADYEYTVNIPGKGVVIVPSDTELQPTEAYQKALSMGADQQPQVTGGAPGEPNMLQRVGGYLRKQLPETEPIKAKTYPELPETDPRQIMRETTTVPSGEMLKMVPSVAGAAAFPAAAAGSLIGGSLMAAAGGGETAQAVGELVGGVAGGAKNIASLTKRLLTNKEAQVQKFTEQFLKTPQALREGITKLLPGFKDQAATLAKQIKEPLAEDVSALYKIAEQTTAEVPTTGIRKIASQALGAESRGLGYKEAKDVMRATLKDVPPGSDSYKNLLETTQRLEGQAKNLDKTNPSAARIIREVKNNITDEMDRFSNAGRLASSLKRQDTLARDMLENLRTGKIEQVKIDLMNKPSIAQRFGWDSQAKIDAAIKQLDKIKSTPTRGSLVEALQRLGGSGLLAYALHRGIFDFVFSGHGR